MNGIVTKLCDADSIEIPQELLTLHVDPQQVEEELQRLSLRYAAECPADTAESGDIIYCQADTAAYPDGRTVLIYTGTALPGTEAAVPALLGHHAGDAVQTQLMDRPTTLTIQKILRRTPVTVDDALIARMGLDGVATVDSYRAYLHQKKLEDLQMERHKELIRYLLDHMLEGCTFSYDEAEMDAFVQDTIRDITEHSPDEAADADPEEMRASILAQEKQRWMAKAFGEQQGVEIQMDQVEAETDQMIEMMQLMGEQVPSREEMIQLTIDDQYSNALFAYLDEIIAKKMGGSYGNR